MSMLENRLRIMARMSVPPVELWMLNRMAEPSEGRMTAKKSSRVFWSVSGADRGHSHSSPDKAAENKREQYTVFTPKLLSRNRKPSTRKARLIREAKVEGLTAGTTALRITARPVTPPVLKWLGNLKK